jgi:hypothetical protein
MVCLAILGDAQSTIEGDELVRNFINVPVKPLILDEDSIQLSLDRKGFTRCSIIICDEKPIVKSYKRLVFVDSKAR